MKQSLLVSTESESQSVNYSTFGKGLQFIAKDSSFYLKFRFRFQTLYSGNYNLETNEYSDNIQIRRARLKFDGFVLNPRVKYKIELSLSNRDFLAIFFFDEQDVLTEFATHLYPADAG